MKLLSETSADEAYDRPLKSRHTIWELTLHIAAWKGEVTKALRGETFRILEPEQNWPPVESADEEAWREAKAMLRRVHGELIEALKGFDGARFDKKVKGAPFTFYVILHGLVQHDLYHAGQIAILRRK
ncbi:MAG TPA: DinB family protein [Patescibacteria group bacterium]|nr:DinB family protein [Patescibacteria group bacterium]